MGREGTIPALRVLARNGQRDVFQTVQERQELCGLLRQQGHRHPAKLSLFRREGRQGHHAGARPESLPRGQWRGAVLLCEGRNGGANRLYGVHVARQAVRHQDPQRPARARGLSERQALFLHPARPAQFLLRHLSRAEPGRTNPRRSAGARARDIERDADLPLGMERHGHHQPALHHLQQPDSRRAAQSAGRRIPRSRILFVLCQQRTADLRTGSAAMSMMKMKAVALASVLLIAGASSALSAGSEADFKTAYAAAEAANKEAGTLRNQWTTTAAALALAKKAAVVVH